MRKWIADAQEAELEEINGELEDELSLLAPSVAIQEVNVNRQPKKWKPVTLHKLVGASKKPIKLTVAQEAREQEALYMEMLADMEEDTNPDDGAIEIDDDDVWGE
jgi:formate dehydrogenase maturation protein FdhE